MTFDVTVPVAGMVNVMESAATQSKRPRLVAAAQQVLLRAPSSQLMLAHHHLRVRKTGTFHMKLAASRRMKSFVAHNRQPIRVQLRVTFMPRNGPLLPVGVYHLVITG